MSGESNCKSDGLPELLILHSPLIVRVFIDYYYIVKYGIFTGRSRPVVP